jgi:hypothetical protein
MAIFSYTYPPACHETMSHFTSPEYSADLTQTRVFFHFIDLSRKFSSVLTQTSLFFHLPRISRLFSSLTAQATPTQSLILPSQNTPELVHDYNDFSSNGLHS